MHCSLSNWLSVMYCDCNNSCPCFQNCPQGCNQSNTGYCRCQNPYSNPDFVECEEKIRNLFSLRVKVACRKKFFEGDYSMCVVSCRPGDFACFAFCGICISSGNGISNSEKKTCWMADSPTDTFVKNVPSNHEHHQTRIASSASKKIYIFWSHFCATFLGSILAVGNPESCRAEIFDRNSGWQNIAAYPHGKWEKYFFLVVLSISQRLLEIPNYYTVRGPIKGVLFKGLFSKKNEMGICPLIFSGK